MTFLLLITSQKTSSDFEPLISITKYCLPNAHSLLIQAFHQYMYQENVKIPIIKISSRQAALFPKIFCNIKILTVPRLPGLYVRDQREWVFEVREVKSEKEKLSLFFEKCKVKKKCFHSFSRSAK